MKVVDILESALAKEKEAISLYRNYLSLLEKAGKADRDIKDIFASLINEENRHKQLLEEKLRRFNFYSNKQT